MADSLAEQFVHVLGADAVLTGDVVRGRSAGAWYPGQNLDADLLVRPDSTEGVIAALKICHEARQPVVTHGGLTGVVEGARTTQGEVILSLERMNRIESVDPVNRTMIVQAGVPLQAAQEAAEARNLLLPLDLGARGSATLGGNAATNAGGNRVIRYGMTRESILGLEAVTADGTRVSSMNQMIKNNAGFDLKQLFIGSEGTLGVVTRLVLRLRARPRSQVTAFCALPGFDEVLAFLSHLDEALGGQLSAFEVIWDNAYQVLSGRPGDHPPLDAGHPFYVLLETLGGSPQRDEELLADALADALGQKLLEEAVLAKSQAEADAMWSIRDNVERFLELNPMFLFDVSLRRSDMESYLATLDDRLGAGWTEHDLYVFGHLGDGNLHLGIRAGPADGSDRKAVESCVYEPLSAVGGSISAEHGIGLEKKDWLSVSRSPEEIALMRILKQALDPRNILNPNKVI